MCGCRATREMLSQPESDTHSPQELMPQLKDVCGRKAGFPMLHYQSFGGLFYRRCFTGITCNLQRPVPRGRIGTADLECRQVERLSNRLR